jgi:hypothetical protein
MTRAADAAPTSADLMAETDGYLPAIESREGGGLVLAAIQVYQIPAFAGISTKASRRIATKQSTSGHSERLSFAVKHVPAKALVDAQISLRRIDSLAVFKLPAGVCCVIVSKALRFD